MFMSDVGVCRYCVVYHFCSVFFGELFCCEVVSRFPKGFRVNLLLWKVFFVQVGFGTVCGCVKLFLCLLAGVCSKGFHIIFCWVCFEKLFQWFFFHFLREKVFLGVQRFSFCFDQFFGEDGGF